MPFDDRFVDQLAQKLAAPIAALEQRRITLRKQRPQRILRGILRVVSAIATFVVVLVVMAKLGIGGGAWILLPLVLAGLVSTLFGSGPQRSLKDEAAAALIPPIQDALKDAGQPFDYHRAPQYKQDAERFRSLGVIGRFNRSRFRDLISGTHRQVDYRMVTANLSLHRSSGRRSSGAHLGGAAGSSIGTSETLGVFTGLLLELSVPSEICGTVLITADFGRIGNALAGFAKGIRSMQRVRFDDPAFEARFAVYAADPQAATAALPPVIRDGLRLLDERFGEKTAAGVQGAFDGGTFFLALPTDRTLMQPIDYGTPLQDPQWIVERLLERILIATEVIDILHGADRAGSTSP
ncbi:MAG: DUF3137 domain-containing protein [Rhodospirillaceae bacterium]|nr:DUF3137 domain-containing protein [Rhodospirillaceae bacterium]